MYHNSSVLVTGGSSTYVAGDLNIHTLKPDTPFQRLENHVTAGALHNSSEVSDQPKCHPGTRIAIREHIETWAKSPTYAYPIMWVHGPAGSGKSSILRTLARILFAQNLLLASFFFLRSAPGRNSSEHFIATIAIQLAISVPPSRPYIEEAIERNPLIFSLSLWDQANTLIIAPLLALCRGNPTLDFRQKFPHVIIVDGLDECQDPDKQCEILQIFCCILKNLPIPLALLLASRPENHIRSAFDLGNLNGSSTRLSLDDSYNPDADIEKYLIDKFSEIERHHREYLPISPWPSPNVVDRLVVKASGQFIYASTIVKFVGSQRHNPVKRLEIILGIIDTGELKPFEELDSLYSAIFLNIDENDRAGVLRILGVLLIPFKVERAYYRSLSFLEFLLNLDTGDMRRMLFDLESLLTFNDDQVRFLHASLGDYLFDRSRSGQFWIDAGEVYANLAQHCTIQLCDSEAPPGYRNFFYRNALLFFANATPTLRLREAIERCDLEIAATFSWRSTIGASFPDTIPTFLQAVRCSAFSDATQLYIYKSASYAKAIRPRIQVYFQDMALKTLLIAVAVAAEAIFRDGLQKSYYGCLQDIFMISDGAREAETNEGFNLSYCDLAIAQVIKTLLDDQLNKDLGYFIDNDQYADIAFHLVAFMTQPPLSRNHPSLLHERRITNQKCISAIFPVILSKSSIRQDLLHQIKNSWPLQIDRSYLEFGQIRDALRTYVARSEAHFKTPGGSKHRRYLSQLFSKLSPRQSPS